MNFQPDEDEPDPATVYVVVPGILMLCCWFLEMLFMLIHVATTVFNDRDPVVLLVILGMRSIPSLYLFGAGAFLLLLANRGRHGALPPSTSTVLLMLGGLGLPMLFFEFITCNILMLPFEFWPVASSLAAGVMLRTQDAP